MIWECQLKAAVIEETMSEVTTSLRHTGEGNKRDEVPTRPSQQADSPSNLEGQLRELQMVAEPVEEYGAKPD